MPLEFSFASVLREIRAIRDLAAPLLNPDDLWVLETFELSLKLIQQQRKEAAWVLPLDNPLRTKRCDGGYEKRTPESPNRRGGRRELFGELTAIWNISPIPEVKTSVLPSRFVVTGLASSKIRLVEELEGVRREFVTWRMELGAVDSPGSFFHVQIGEEDEESPVCQPLPIPRIPCAPITPLLALEFMLSELFQNAWPDRLDKEPERTKEWRNIQLERYQAFLGWQTDTLAKKSGSVLLSLKDAQPPSTLLLGVQ